MAGQGRNTTRKVLLAGGVLALHAAILAPLALRQIEREEAVAPSVFEITLERPRRTLTASADVSSPDALESPVSRTAFLGESASVENTPADFVPKPTQAEVDDRWRVQPHYVRPGGVAAPRRIAGDCLNILEDRPQCRAFGAPLRTIEAELPGENPAVARAQAQDRRRDDGFARQARANEAWRDYTRGEGSYPGLRSMLSER